MLVQNGMFVSYVGKTVTVFNSEGVLRTFKEIKVFQVYDVLTGFSTFSPSSEAVTYEGYGKCGRHSLLTICEIIKLNLLQLYMVLTQAVHNVTSSHCITSM